MSNVTKLSTSKKETEDGLRGVVQLLDQKVREEGVDSLLVFGTCKDGTLFTVNFDCVRGDLVGYADQRLTGMKLMLCEFMEETAQYDEIPDVED